MSAADVAHQAWLLMPNFRAPAPFYVVEGPSPEAESGLAGLTSYPPGTVALHDAGRRTADVVWVDGFQPAISAKVVALLDAEGVKGWSLADIRLRTRTGETDDSFHLLRFGFRCPTPGWRSVETRSLEDGSFSWQVRSGMLLEGCDFEHSDFYLPLATLHLVCSPKVYSLFRRAKVTGVDFTSAEDFEV
jgi:hypothetical protein